MKREPATAFDYVIVGAGTAGCVLANRLSADPSRTVCLLEAGPSDRSLFIRMPAALTIPIESKVYNWGYVSEPEAQLNGRRIGQARGRCLGGSSSINGMVFVRGNPQDFDGWREFGIEGWDFEDCLPYFKKLETFHGQPSPLRGGDGPVSVVESKADHVFYRSFLEAADQFGLPRAADYNGAEQEGAHVTQATIRDGARCSAADAYLRPALRNPNLKVIKQALATRLLFEGRRATGVAYEARGQVRAVRAETEVILCAGTIGSPQILMLSGVGPADHLKSLDIPILADLPGVGENLQDHVVAPLRYRSDKPLSLSRDLTAFGRARLGLEWLLSRRGLGASNFFEVGAFFRSEGAGYVNLQHEFLPFLADFRDGKVVLGDGFQYFVSQMRPKSRGRIRLKSADPKAKPAIHFNYLSHPEDLREMLEGIRLTREMARQRAWDAFRSEALDPAPDAASDADLTAWLRQSANTEHHPAGTCRMGADPFAVTDGQGRVHGLERLRVVDGSILPLVPTANINAPIFMLAEKIAAAMRARDKR